MPARCILDFRPWYCLTGRIERGVINVGDEMKSLVSATPKEDDLYGVEMFKKLLDRGEAANGWRIACAHDREGCRARSGSVQSEVC